MTEPTYRCGKCWGPGFIVHTSLIKNPSVGGPVLVWVKCKTTGCNNSVEAPSIIQAFEAISKKPEPEGGNS